MADTHPAPAKSRSRQTMRDLTLSMLLVGLFVAFLYIIVLRPAPDPVRVVDTASAAVVAQQAGAFQVYAPVGLTDGWRATSARYTPGPVDGTGQWYNGYLTPEGESVVLVQQDFNVNDMLKEQTRSGTADGEQNIDGVTWQRYHAAADGQWSLVRVAGDDTIVITGTVPCDELATFAASLQPVSTSSG